MYLCTKGLCTKGAGYRVCTICTKGAGYVLMY